MEKKQKRLTKLSEIPDASEESLKRSLLTKDGRGPKFKSHILSELILRARERAFSECAVLDNLDTM